MLSSECRFSSFLMLSYWWEGEKMALFYHLDQMQAINFSTTESSWIAVCLSSMTNIAVF